MSYEAEDYINFIEQGRKDKLSPSGLDLIAKQFRVMQEQLKTCNKPAVIKSCENCKFDAECRHKQVMPLGYHYCKFYIEHVL